MSFVSTEEMLIEKIEALKNKESYYKLKRFEKKELKALRKQLNQIKEEKRILEEENKKRLQKLEEERKAHLQKLEEERKAHLQKLEEERKAHLKELEEKDKKRNEEKKKEILKKQLESRTKASSNSQKKDKGEVIKDMCILSDITKKEIIEEKKNNPDKFIKTEEALKCHNKESSVFVMGLLAKHLENNGITTAIEKNINQNDLEEGNTTLQFMVNGLGQKTRYNLHFDIGEERNEELLYNEEEQRKFIDKLKKNYQKNIKFLKMI